MGMFNTDWDVDKYKNEFESEEHWKLRRQFMLAHKKKYPELRLVCLTQVFFNMEFLGCKYPQKTMDLVTKLAAEVAEEFRESRKDKLKRTFVGAQDAAGAKAKGAKPPTGAVEGSDMTDEGSAKKKPRIDQDIISIDDEETSSGKGSPGNKSHDDEGDDVDWLKDDKQEATGSSVQSLDTGGSEQYADALKEVAKKFILFIPPRANSKTERDPICIIHHNFMHKQMSFRFNGSKAEGGWTCELWVNPDKESALAGSKCDLLIASSFATTQRLGKQQTAQMAVEYLKKYCTYIEPNPAWFQEGGTPEFIQKRIPCNKNPRTYLIMRKEDTGHISPEVADLLLLNFYRSSNQDMFFKDNEYTESEKIQLMNRSKKHKLGFRHFGSQTMLKHHHVCIFKEKTADEILDEARQMGGKHPKYLIHYKK